MKTFLITAAVAAVVVMSSGCGMLSRTKEVGMTASSTIPAAQGTVKIQEAANGNTSIDVIVKHLADPGRLSPPANAYVVWVRGSETGSPQNVGALAVDKNLDGQLHTTTPLHTFDLFVTAEGSGQAQTPSGPQLLWTSYNR